MATSSIADLPILVASVLLLLGVLASRLGGRLGLPGLLLFMAVGMLAGSDGLGGIWFDNYGLAQFVGVVTLVFILFSGGLSTDWQRVRPVLGRGLLLATLGVLITAGLVGVAAHALFGMPWGLSLLLGAVVSSTDASAVFSVLRERGANLKGNTEPLLELESGINDPMAVFLVAALTQWILQPELTLWQMVPSFFQQMLVGALLGYLLGRGMIWSLSRWRLPFDGLYAVVSVAHVGLIYGLTALLGGSGFLAVYVAGLMLGGYPLARKRALRGFHEGITYLLEVGMFLLLGLLVFPSQLPPLVVPALILTLFLVFVARPVAVYLNLAFSPMPLNQKTLVAWVGLRGAVPIILATFPLLAGVPGAKTIFNVAFFVVLANVLIQGVSLPWVARVLRVAELEATEG